MITFIKDKGKRIASLLLLFALLINMTGAILSYAYAAGGSYSSLGTNQALGSPILNDSFSLDDWNKWEMIVWGIFLSNFTTPFVDDYNSAFNLDSGYGSEGSGVQALEFGTGRDPANTETIRDLLDYAINQQSSGATKRIYVAYNKLDDGEIVSTANFNTNNAPITQTNESNEQSGEENTETEEENQVISDSEVTGESGQDAANNTAPIRQATVKDLLFATADDGTNNTYVHSTDSEWIGSTYAYLGNYPDMVGVTDGNIPTFAIQTSSGAYETVFDYTDSYDLAIVQAILSRGYTSDFRDAFVKSLNTVFANPESYTLVLDCFGNICTQIDGTYRVIVPAAANQYLTQTPSINLVNSLIFNASTNTVGASQIINNGGQSHGGWLETALGSYQSGLPAFSNGSEGITPGSMLLYYDTDTIVLQKAKEEGYTLVDPYDSNKSTVAYAVDTGEVYQELFELDINNSDSQKYAFKIEPANFNLIDTTVLFGTNANSSVASAYKNTLMYANELVNIFNKTPDRLVLDSIQTDTGEVSLFGDAVVVSVQLNPGENLPWLTAAGNLGASIFGGTQAKYGPASILRRFVNYTYQAYQNNIETEAGIIESNDVREAIANSDNPIQMFENLLLERGVGNVSMLFKGFVIGRTEFYDVNDINALNRLTYLGPLEGASEFGSDVPIIGGILSGAGTAVESIADFLASDGVGTMLFGQNLSNDEAFSMSNLADIPLFSRAGGTVTESNASPFDTSPFGRSVKVYTTSEVMRSVANILGVREGTEFAVYSTYIYLTYLDWYGITSTSLSSLSGTDNTSLLNPDIFDGSSDVLNADISSITTVMTEEQKEKQILDWTYLMLNPSEGREYRSNMIISGVADWIYDNYQKIVYGNASSYYGTGSGVSSRNSTGFLAIEPYSENFMTAWFIENYSYFVSILIGIFIILIIIVGVLNKRKISWYFVAAFAMINMLLILPATGEIAPLVSNTFVQNLFSDKMTYWAISEGVTNATMESDYVTGNTISSSYLGSLSTEEQKQVVGLVKNLNSLYTDRSLNIRQDISKKVTATSISTYEDVQQLRSARWMLPMIMRQFSADDSSANYVYVPLADKYEDLSNWYWYFKPGEAVYAKTINSTQVSDSTANIPNAETDKWLISDNASAMAKGWFSGYTDVYEMGSQTDGVYSIAYARETDRNIHTYNYMLPYGLLASYSTPTHDDSMSYDDWAESVATLAVSSMHNSDIAAVTREIEQNGGEYNRFERSTVNKTFGFLWATENPLHYFYAVIQDSFQSDLSVGGLAGELSGRYSEVVDSETGEGTGVETRRSFMHYADTGNIRDILDLEGMFTNMIPYLYAMQLGAAGYGDVDGYFSDDDMIEFYDTYSFMPKSWLYRSNWVTKIMENDDFHDSYRIGLADGSDATVTNMLLPSAYEAAGRKMVFSEAEMYASGLTEQDLSLIELKCVQVNRDVSRSWTTLINYVSVPGMTVEVMKRQMALDALLIFNEEFSPAGVLGAAFQMYPTGIDLRSISFDSVMKMLMLNVTHDTSYIYGDTMQTIVEDSDIFTAILLLITAFICAFLIPLARNILMGLIFFLGLWAIIWSIFRTTKTKLKVSCGYFISNVVFLALTLIYYAGFSLLMAMTTSDEVLSVSQIEVNTGNPVWCMIFVLVLSILYCVGIYKIAVLCVRNYRDMGFEVYAGIAEMTMGKLSNGIEKVGSKLSNTFGLGGATADAMSSSGGSRGNSRKDPVDVRNADDDRNMGSSGSGNGGPGGGNGSGRNNRNNNQTAPNDPYADEKSSYTDGRSEIDDSHESVDIDEQIKKGKEIQEKEEKEERRRSSSSSSRQRETRDSSRTASPTSGGQTGGAQEPEADDYYSARSGYSERDSRYHSSRREESTNRQEQAAPNRSAGDPNELGGSTRTTTTRTERTTSTQKTQSTKRSEKKSGTDISRTMGDSIDNRQNPGYKQDF